MNLIWNESDESDPERHANYFDFYSHTNVSLVAKKTYERHLVGIMFNFKFVLNIMKVFLYFGKLKKCLAKKVIQNHLKTKMLTWALLILQPVRNLCWVLNNERLKVPH